MYHRFVVAAGSVAASLILAAAASAQTGVISGTVLDETNKAALQGVQVAIKGTQLVGVTNKDGKFTITGVPTGAQQIEAWRVGYRNFKLSALRIAANDTVSVFFSLASNAADDPVAVAEVLRGQAAEELRAEREALARLEQRLRRIDSAGTQGVGIRNPVMTGVQPLIIVDGVIQRPDFDQSSIGIHSIEIVRGAAAVELYGQRAVNGVINIRTRK